MTPAHSAMADLMILTVAGKHGARVWSQDRFMNRAALCLGIPRL